ncbi:MAG: hypothetical protein AAFP23_08365, partial [Pseudomonadota bacterium]
MPRRLSPAAGRRKRVPPPYRLPRATRYAETPRARVLRRRRAGEAYKRQEQRRSELGLEPGFYWPAILLEAGCT